MPVGSAARLFAADLQLAGRVLKSRAYFGPHPTNLNRREEFRPAYGEYLAARAAGGAALVVTEVASVSREDWPYEYAPLLPAAASSLAATASAVRGEGSLLVAGIGHAGGQGSSAHSQQVLWAPSPFAETTTNELSAELEEEAIEAIIADFATAAASAVAAGCDGVELNAGQFSLIRQFLSPLTNQRGDRWGEDRALFASAVLEAVRRSVAGGVVGMRLCIDELAPWAGILPPRAAEIFADLADRVDYLVLERGSIYTHHATCPDFHAGTGFLDEALAEFKATCPLATPLALVDGRVTVREAEEMLATGEVQLAELTRALIADPEALARLAAGGSERPCVACNQGCQVRDPRNPVVTCAFNPDAGHEAEAKMRDGVARGRARDSRPAELLVAGGGLAGMEAALHATRLGIRVRLYEASGQAGGELALLAGHGPNPRLARLLEYYLSALATAKVEVRLSHPLTSSDLLAAAEAGNPVVVATGGLYLPRPSNLARLTENAPVGSPRVVGAAQALREPPQTGCKVVLFDPTGGPWAMNTVDALLTAGVSLALVTPDRLPGSQLALTGDLVPAAQRLARAGVPCFTDTTVAGLTSGGVSIEERFGPGRRTLEAEVVVDCSPAVAAGGWPEHRLIRPAGDALAPRGWQAAVLDARRAVATLTAEVADGGL